MTTPLQASQIAALLNRRNELTRQYTADMVLKESENYVFLESDGQVFGCARTKEVQWYQWEICHLSVAESHLGNGYGRELLALAEEKALAGNAQILQCTIRSNNAASRSLFQQSGYQKVNSFRNRQSGNEVFVYQKVI
jgi:ribosomal protein S18 acetylase RimI-like enzyme